MSDTTAPRLTDEEVKSHLRQAVTAGVIYGWYRHQPHRKTVNGVEIVAEWVINPDPAPTVSYDAAGIREFVDMLSEAPDA